MQTSTWSYLYTTSQRNIILSVLTCNPPMASYCFGVIYKTPPKISGYFFCSATIGLPIFFNTFNENDIFKSQWCDLLT